KDKFIAVVSDVEAAMQSVKRKAKTILQKCQKIVTFFHDEYRAEDALYKKIKSSFSKGKNNIKLILSHNGIIGNDIADKLAKKGQCGNNLFRNNVDFINNILSYFPVFIDNPIKVNIRRFILKILAT
ncbi:19216_t:CDS:2, partial [Rhizophagus irregularis]